MAHDDLDLLVLDLDPNQIIRKSEGRKYFGFKHSQLDEKIKDGSIPAPFPLSENGRAVGWLGRQIIAHHQKRLAAAKRREAAAADEQAP
jgi:predicted DNA-binding transcriptional regulator AlpA